MSIDAGSTEHDVGRVLDKNKETFSLYQPVGETAYWPEWRFSGHPADALDT